MSVTEDRDREVLPVEGFRLSPQQEHLWAQLERPPEAGRFRFVGSVSLEGRLDREAFGRALSAVVARHEVLRTSFRTLPGMSLPLQVVGAPRPAAPEGRDLGVLPADRQALAVEELIEEAMAEPLPLDRESLVRWWLLSLDEAGERHMLLIGLPALLTDPAGLDNLVREVARAYAAEVGAEAPADEPMQYVDLSEWQHDLLEGEETQEGRDYWAKAAPPRPSSPILPPALAPGAPGFEPRRGVAVPLPAVVADGLERLAEEVGGEPSEVLLAAWAVLAARCAGTSPVVVGASFDGRRFEELQDPPGLFARWLPLAVEVAADRPFRRLVEALHHDRAGHASWQEYFSWSHLLGGAAAGDPVAYPLAWEHRSAAAEERAGGVVFRRRQLRGCGEGFVVKLVTERRGGTLEARIEHDARRVTVEEAGLLAERLATLAASGVHSPDRPVGELELVGPGERRRLLVELNESRRDHRRPPLLHRLVEEQARATPGRTALLFEEELLSYADLDARAERLARRLRGLGLKAEERVAVAAERSPELVVSLLAVLKAGGAYVPLDPSYPLERLRSMLADARPRVLVAGPGAPPELLRHEGLSVLDPAPDGEGPTAELPSDVDPDQLAYVLYTSGSTGRPKGVMVSHRAITNRLLWMQRVFPLGADDAVLQKTPFGFDASIWELFVPLLAGARLVLARPGGHGDPAYLVDALAAHEVTVLQLVPSLLGVFLEEQKLAACGRLARVFCGGELLPGALRDRFFSRLGADLANLYGPTECAIDVSFHPCRRDEGGSAVPIGRPIDNLRLHVLDGRLELVPQGTAGELWAAGRGLARGYLGSPAQTAGRFLPDPFSPEGGGRLYRTGDLARRRGDGALEFLGRVDRQLKLRGVRIELGEIEVSLAAHPAVREAVVAVRDDGPGAGEAGAPDDRRLVGYFVAAGGSAVSGTELRSFLAARLPEAMVPAAVVELRELPRLASGKVDRTALPAPEPSGGTGRPAAPRTPTEELLASAWAEVLGVETLGIHDSAFELGWHSLMATRLASRLRRLFGVEVPLRSFFEHPTVASLAAYVDALLRGGAAEVAPAIEPAPRDRPLPLSFAQQRLWFLDRLEPGSPFYNIPTALRFDGELNVAVLARTLSEVVRRHESLRTTFAEVGEEPVQVVAPPRPVELPLVDLSALVGEDPRREAERLASAAASRPFDLARGPLLRATLVRLGEAEHVGLLTLHHIVSDGWSTAVLTREVGALYEAFSEGRRSPLPEPVLQYADFAHWQRGWLEGEVLEAHLAFWRQQLDGAPPVLELAADRPRPEVQRFRGTTRSRRFAPELDRGVRELARREGATSFMVLFAAGQVLLGFYGGAEDLVVGTDVANRNRAETEGMIGFFINQLALRTRLEGDPSFRELVGRVRETSLGAYAHQDLPFDKLVEVLRPGRSLTHSPLFQVKINLVDLPMPELELPGLRVAPLASARSTAQFDWILNLYQMEDGLSASVESSADLFEPATIDRMLTVFESLLGAVLARPEARLSELAAVLEEADDRERLARREEKSRALGSQLRGARRRGRAGEVVP